jgi:hypothetical protein
MTMYGGVSFKVYQDLGPQLKRFAKLVKLDVKLVMREEMRLGLETAQKLTPPTKSPSNNVKTLYTTLRNAGTKTLRHDLNNVAKPMRYQSARIPRLRDAILRGQINLAQAIVNNLPSNHSWSRRTIITGSQFEKMHRALQNRRGRVRRDANNLIMDVTARDNYLSRMGSGVGIAKASFTPALKQLGSKKWKTKYISRHGDKFGSYSESDTTVEIVATLNGFKRPMSDVQSMIDSVFRKRGVAMNTKIKRVLDGRAITMGKLDALRTLT